MHDTFSARFLHLVYGFDLSRIFREANTSVLFRNIYIKYSLERIEMKNVDYLNC